MSKSKRAKAPEGCYWRGDTLYALKKIKGQKYRQSLETSDPAVAVTARDQWLKDLMDDLKHADNRRTCVAVIAEWKVMWPKINERLGPKTLKRYICSLNQMTDVLGTEEKPLLDIHHIDNEVLTEIIELRLQQDEVETRTLKNDLGALSSVLDYAVFKNYRVDNPVPAILRRLKARPEKIVPPDRRDIDIIAARAPQGVKNAMDAAEVTGCRLDELVKAKRSHITGNNLKQFTITGKRNKTRTIDLTPFDGYETLTAIPAFVGKDGAVDVLIWHDDGKAYRTLASQFCRLQWETFCEFYDKAHGTNDATRPSRADLFNYENEPDRPGWKDIGFRRFRFHDLRHLHAVAWLKSGRSIYDLKERLGHTSVKTTEVYTNDETCGLLTADEKRRVMGYGTSQIAVA